MDIFQQKLEAYLENIEEDVKKEQILSVSISKVLMQKEQLSGFPVGSIVRCLQHYV